MKRSSSSVARNGPASCGFVPASAAIVIGTNANGMATPSTRKPGRRSTQYEPPTGTSVKSRRPIVSRLIPTISVGLMPTNPVHGRGPEIRPHDGGARDGDVAEAGLDHVLRVQREHQEHREQRRAQNQTSDVGRRQPPQAEDAKRPKRLALPPQREGGKRRGRCGEDSDGRSRTPRPLPALRNGEDKQGQHRDDEVAPETSWLCP
jgi:hypothetical protein